MESNSPVMELARVDPAPVVKRQSFIEIAEEIVSLFQMRAALEEEEDSPEKREQLQAIEHQIDDSVYGQLADKSDAIAWAQRKMDLAVADLQDIGRAIDEKIGRINQQKARLRNMTLTGMKVMGAPCIKGQVSRITLTEPAEKKLEVFEENSVPLKYFTPITSYVLDKAKVTADLERDVLVPGARLKDREPYITIMLDAKKPKRLKE